MIRAALFCKRKSLITFSLLQAIIPLHETTYGLHAIDACSYLQATSMIILLGFMRLVMILSLI